MIAIKNVLVTTAAVLCIIYPSKANAQSVSEDNSIENALNEEKVYDMAFQMPQYPGGASAMFSYLSSNIKYPLVAQENHITGRVIVTFVVECDGTIGDIKVVKSVDPSLDKEAMRVVGAMPKWIPGKLESGEVVRVKYTIPITFSL